MQITEGETRRIGAQSVEPAVFAAAPARSAPSRPRDLPLVPGPPEVVLFALAAAPADPAPLQYLAAAASPWPGGLAIWRGGESGGFDLVQVADLPAVIGRTLTPLPAGPLWRWDRVATLDVLMSAPAHSAIDDPAALAGGNLMAVEGPDGVWEILSAAGVTLIGERTYRLSRLLRGLGGSEAAAGRLVPAWARIVQLDEGVVPLTAALADLGRSLSYRIGPAGRDIADPAVVEVSAMVTMEALKPLAPVHPRGRRTPEGVQITWIRRSRRDGDSWDVVEIPLGEESEAYALDIIRDGTVIRTLAAASQAVLYPAADELADLGAPQSMLSVVLAQLSAIVGRGFPLEATLEILPGEGP
jgi:hypothetical protein